MITRVFRARVHPGKEADFERFLREVGIPTATAQPGCRAVSAGRNLWSDTPEFFVVTTWDSVDAIRAFAGADWQHAVVAPEEEDLLVGVSTDHFEVLA
jgi:heme-degrading monooxygenase HmoA